ncbi:MAG TPA: LCP family protein [Jiangellaceae bacterium]
MSERDEVGRRESAPYGQAEPPPTPEPSVGTYTAGKVPGVWYEDGVAHSPPAEGQVGGRGPRPFVNDAAAQDSPVHPDALRPGEAPPRPLDARPEPADAVAGVGATPRRGDTSLMPGDAPPATAPPRRSGADRPPPRPKRPRRFRPWRIVLALPILLLAGLVTIAVIAWSRIDKVDAIPDDPGGAVSASQVYMLVGSDSRAELSDEERSELGTGSPTSQLADTIMLLYIPNDGDPALISIPRDSLVDIPGQGTNRINAAYSFGGPQLLVQTVQQNTGVAIDDYVQIGLGGFANIVDALGGVDLCLDQAIADDKAHIDLPAGCQTLDGPNALGYARARQFDPRSDLGRVERQREIVGAIADQTLSLDTFVNPLKLTRLGLASGDALTIDEGTGPLALGNFALTMGRLVGDGNTLTVPLGNVGNTVEWHPEDAPRLWAALQAGEPIPDDLLNAEQ